MNEPNEVWAADITYVPTGEGWLYLAGVLDLGSRRVVGWAMGESLGTSLPMDALRMALRQRRPTGGLLHHSDRGCQYASEAYREQLAAWKLTPSMSRRGNCYDKRRHGELLEHAQGRTRPPHPFCEPRPGKRAPSSITSKSSTTASASTAPSVSCPLWNLKNRGNLN